MSIKEHGFFFGSKAIGAVATLRGVMHCLGTEEWRRVGSSECGERKQRNTKTSNEAMHS